MPRQPTKRKPTVLIVSHERSGTHYLINSIAMNLGYSNIETSIVGTPGQLFRAIAAEEHTGKILKSHHQSDFFPEIDRMKNIVRIIYLRRDGKDCLTSCYHYMKKNAGLKCFPVFDRDSGRLFDFGEFLRANPSKYPFDARYSMRQSKNMPERWARHTKSWLNKTYEVRFEELKRDFNGTMLRVARHLELNPPHVFVEPKLCHRGIDNRLGVVGDYKNIFTKSDDKFFDNEVLRVMGE